MENNAPAPSSSDLIHTSIWHEVPAPDNPFASHAAYCRGYDVYGAMLGAASWVDMLWLLFKPELPPARQLQVMETLAVALANPGPRDPSVHAAMSGMVGGAPAAAALIAALAVGAGRCGGAREVYDAMVMWKRHGADVHAWLDYAGQLPDEPVEVFPERAHVPGFEPHGVTIATPVRQTLDVLSRLGAGTATAWLCDCADTAARVTGLPVAMTGVAAAVLHDLGFTPEEGEMLFLLLRLPGAAAHALEQRVTGFKRFPFYRVELDANGLSRDAA